MSILDALRAEKQQSNNLADLALLPQALIMSMAQRGEIREDMVMPILAKKAENAESAARQVAMKQAGQGAQPTVMESLLGRIANAENPTPAPQEMTDVGVAQLPTQPMSMAGGGIIAFDDGGEVDEEDDVDTYREELRRKARQNQMYDMIESLQGSAGGQRPSMEGNAGVGITAGKGGDGLRDKIMQIESGGRRYDKSGNLLTSSKGAQGEMQVMPGTARDPGFGIKAARDNSPDELRRVGDDYVSMLMGRYGNPQLAAIAYNMGPGATDKWLQAGANMNKLPEETRNYVKKLSSMAQGGEVKHYAAGGPSMTDPDEDERSAFQQDLIDIFGYSGAKNARPEVPEYLKRTKNYFTKPRQPVTKDEAAFENMIARNSVAPTKIANTETPTPTPIPTPANTAAIPKEALGNEDKFLQYIMGREAKQEKAVAQDKDLALLAAGLGILGGTSQYAFENIGKGGTAGVQQLANSQKLRASQDAAIGKLYAAGYENQVMNQIRRDQLAERKESKAATLTQADRLAGERLEQGNTEKRAAYVQKALGQNPMLATQLQNLEGKQMELMSKGQQLDAKDLARLKFFRDERKKVDDEAARSFPSPGRGNTFAGYSAKPI